MSDASDASVFLFLFFAFFPSPMSDIPVSEQKDPKNRGFPRWRNLELDVRDPWDRTTNDFYDHDLFECSVWFPLAALLRPSGGVNSSGVDFCVHHIWRRSVGWLIESVTTGCGRCGSASQNERESGRREGNWIRKRDGRKSGSRISGLSSRRDVHRNDLSLALGSGLCRAQYTVHTWKT
jgi:hypothetical protein